LPLAAECGKYSFLATTAYPRVKALQAIVLKQRERSKFLRSEAMEDFKGGGFKLTCDPAVS
jgi:hypothetical protein